MVKELENLGFEVISMPMISIKVNDDTELLQKAFDQLHSYDWLVFTSRNAVRYFFQLADELGIKLFYFSDLKIATVGEKTKLELEQLGYRTNFVPIEYTAEVLAENMDDLQGKNILIPRSSIASNHYVEEMTRRGAKVTTIDLYHTLEVEYSKSEMQLQLSDPPDFLTFTSPSAVKSFARQINHYHIQLGDSKVICIGPSTAKSADSLGLKVDYVAQPHTVEGMIEILKDHANV